MMTDYGYKPLVAWITEHMKRMHSPPRPVEHLLTCGNTNGIDLCLRTLLRRGDAVLSEEFTYASTLQVRAASCVSALHRAAWSLCAPPQPLTSPAPPPAPCRRCGRWA